MAIKTMVCNISNFLLHIIAYLIKSKVQYFRFLNNKILQLYSSINNYLYILLLLRMTSLLRFLTLVEFTAVDFYNKRNNNFGLYFLLCSYEFNMRINFITFISSYFQFPSLEFCYKNSVWSQREIQEMFGIFFSNSKDVRRLLTDYGFQGFCLKKDFPLTGYFELRYDDESLTLVMEKLELIQEIRFFNIKGVWERN